MKLSAYFIDIYNTVLMTKKYHFLYKDKWRYWHKIAIYPLSFNEFRRKKF